MSLFIIKGLTPLPLKRYVVFTALAALFAFSAPEAYQAFSINAMAEDVARNVTGSVTSNAVAADGRVSHPEKAVSNRVTIGVIRWDAWFADKVNPYETNLADKKWHGRLPFFAKIISGTNVQVRGDTQAAVDQEIAYAKAGGVDYWAFLYYSPGLRNDGFNHDYMNRVCRLYLSSKRKGDVNFCLIVAGTGDRQIVKKGYNISMG